MIIKNWTIINNKVLGEIYGNPEFEDGEFVRTSEIKELNGNIVITQNNTYLLEIKEA